MKYVFKSLVGSHNYNLNTAESDKDYKVFTLPTFEDLYNGTFYCKSEIGESEDLDFHDIRRLPQLLYKSNINFLEVLFSIEMSKSPDLTSTQSELLEELLDIRDKIAAMNLPFLYNACRGMCFGKVKGMDKGTSSTSSLVDKFGYDTKAALHAYRVLDVLERFYKTDFQSFEAAIKYTKQHEVDFLLSIKKGVFSRTQFLKLLDDKYERIDSKTVSKSYIERNIDNNTVDHLNTIVKEIVREGLLNNI